MARMTGVTGVQPDKSLYTGADLGCLYDLGEMHEVTARDEFTDLRSTEPIDESVDTLYIPLTKGHYMSGRGEGYKHAQIRPQGTYGMTMGHFSMHDAITWLIFLVYHGYIKTQYTDEFYVKVYTPELARLTALMYNKMVNVFNRGFVGMRVQFLENMVHSFSQREINSQRIFRVQINMADILSRYSLDNGYLFLEHIPLHVSTILDTLNETDPVHAGLTTALSWHGAQVLQHFPTDQLHKVVSYISKYNVNIPQTGSGTVPMGTPGAQLPPQVQPIDESSTGIEDTPEEPTDAVETTG